MTFVNARYFEISKLIDIYILFQITVCILYVTVFHTMIRLGIERSGCGGDVAAAEAEVATEEQPAS